VCVCVCVCELPSPPDGWLTIVAKHDNRLCMFGPKFVF
jgi:hypothetical protein